MRSLARMSALVVTGALLLTLQARPTVAAAVPVDEAPCQVWCEALTALCQLFGGGYLCNDMREGCYFGCRLKVT